MTQFELKLYSRCTNCLRKDGFGTKKNLAKQSDMGEPPPRDPDLYSFLISLMENVGFKGGMGALRERIGDTERKYMWYMEKRIP